MIRPVIQLRYQKNTRTFNNFLFLFRTIHPSIMTGEISNLRSDDVTGELPLKSLYYLCMLYVR